MIPKGNPFPVPRENKEIGHLPLKQNKTQEGVNKLESPSVFRSLIFHRF